MREKLTYLHKNETWVFVDKLENKKIVGCNRIFREKMGYQG